MAVRKRDLSWVLVAAVVLTIGAASAVETLHLMHICSTYLTPLHQRNLPAVVQFAVDLINNSSVILPDYRLKVHVGLTRMVSQ